ncbi:MAG: hypothetical protein LBI79_10550 [Nitrososphaerota archaeon]|jgi:hypothetical protein|nr:hypothetical protein [Nitrososphaerota archaeon]
MKAYKTTISVAVDTEIVKQIDQTRQTSKADWLREAIQEKLERMQASPAKVELASSLQCSHEVNNP